MSLIDDSLVENTAAGSAMVDGLLDDVDFDSAITVDPRVGQASRHAGGRGIGRSGTTIGPEVMAAADIAAADMAAQPIAAPTPVAPSRRRIHRARPGTGDVDRTAGQQAVVQLLTALGRNPADEHLADTPRRVVDALIELTTPQDFDFTTFPNDEGYDEMVVELGIPIHSLCEHHLLPFVGVAHIAYIPDERILGISKLARVAEMFARDLQVQERLSAQIANWLDDNLQPKGVGVVIEAEHMCQSLRGVKAAGTRTVTTALRGAIRSDTQCRNEFLALTRHHGR